MEYIDIYSIITDPDLQYKNTDTVLRKAKEYASLTKNPEELESMPINLWKKDEKIILINGHARIGAFKIKVENGDDRFKKIPSNFKEYKDKYDAYINVTKLNSETVVSAKENDKKILNLLKYKPEGQTLKEYAKIMSNDLNDSSITEEKLGQMIGASRIREIALKEKLRNIDIINNAHYLSLYLIAKRFSQRVPGKKEREIISDVNLITILNKIDSTGKDGDKGNWNKSKVENFMNCIWSYPTDMRELIIEKFDPTTIKVLRNEEIIESIIQMQKLKSILLTILKNIMVQLIY